MALVSSLFTAISGLQNHQTMLDVISNNIANVSTTAFKANRVTFTDMLNQTLSSAAGPSAIANTGGVNPVQLGLGVSLGAIDTVWSQGTLQVTGNPTDMAISGDGFFIVNSGNDTLYTRDGTFRFDAAGSLVTASGGLVQGWMPGAVVNPVTGQVDPLAALRVDSSNPATIQDIVININSVMKPQETRTVEFGGNLDAGATAANLTGSSSVSGTASITVQDNILDGANSYTYTVGQHEINFTVMDSLGNEHQLIATFTNVSGTQIPDYRAGQVYENNTWKWEVNVDSSDTSVSLLPDNLRYIDPVTGQEVRSSHSGLMRFTTGGALDYVTYGDANDAATLADWLLPGAVGALLDQQNGTVIGFEGAATPIPIGDLTPVDQYGADATNPFYDPSNPLLNPAYVGGTWDNPPDANGMAVAGTLAGMVLEKLPIVLVYETFDTASPTTQTVDMVSGTTPGIRVNFQDPVTLYDGYVDFSVPAGEVPVSAFVQKVDIDWGSVSQITRADFDIYDQDVLGALVPEAPGATGDGERDSSPGGGAPVAVVSDNSGGRDGLTQDASGEWQIINGVNTYVPYFNAYMTAQDGYQQGVLQSLSVMADGTVVGVFNNNQTQNMARIALANFQNPGGLARIGETTFAFTANSGYAVVGEAGTSGRGAIFGGVLEQSNVDLAQELTNMIVAQRGFEANARLITTSDRILDTLVNLGR